MSDTNAAKTAPLTVAVCAPIMGRELGPIRAVAAQVCVIDANAAFDAFREARLAKDRAAIRRAENELHDLLAPAEVVCMMYPVLDKVAALAPKMRWLHHSQAGVSNLMSSDVWNAAGVTITSGRGHVRPTAIAEYCIAAALAVARGLHDGYVNQRGDRLDRSRYRSMRIDGATLGVIGLGGIGKEVARLARALGMRVIATRRSVREESRDVDHADLLLPAAQWPRLAAACDFIVVSTALTPETRHLLDADFFSALQKRPVLVNISRGEVIDESAMIAALDSGRLRAAVLDVYEHELEGQPPRPELLSYPNVLLTPHISGLGAADDASFMELFCENLRRYINGEALINTVDRRRGY